MSVNCAAFKCRGRGRGRLSKLLLKKGKLPSIILALILAPLLSPAQAVTRIYVQNNTTFSFDVKSSVSGAPLSGSHWRQIQNRIEPWERAEVLWFNRDEGITDGKRFYFKTELSSQGVPKFVVRQQLLGKTINSHMWQALDIFGEQPVHHPWFDDRNTRIEKTFTSRRPDSPLIIRYRAFFTGTDDNIEYILQQDYTPPNLTDNDLSVLAYNVYMRPTSIKHNGQAIRARLLPQKMAGYDAIVFSEAFDDDVRSDLIKRFSPSYPYTTQILGTDRGVEQDGGVIIISRWPIEKEDQKLFGEICAGIDCMADKGVLYAKINKNGRRFHVFGTHTQDGDHTVRQKQFRIIRAFIEAQNISPYGQKTHPYRDINMLPSIVRVTMPSYSTSNEA